MFHPSLLKKYFLQPPLPCWWEGFQGSVLRQHSIYFHPHFGKCVISTYEQLYLCFSVCQDDDYQCQNGHCVLKQYTCNGRNECGDYSDEQNCGMMLIINPA